MLQEMLYAYTPITDALEHVLGYEDYVFLYQSFLSTLLSVFYLQNPSPKFHSWYPMSVVVLRVENRRKVE